MDGMSVLSCGGGEGAEGMGTWLGTRQGQAHIRHLCCQFLSQGAKGIPASEMLWYNSISSLPMLVVFSCVTGEMSVMGTR